MDGKMASALTVQMLWRRWQVWLRARAVGKESTDSNISRMSSGSRPGSVVGDRFGVVDEGVDREMDVIVSEAVPRDTAMMELERLA